MLGFMAGVGFVGVEERGGERVGYLRAVVVAAWEAFWVAFEVEVPILEARWRGERAIGW